MSFCNEPRRIPNKFKVTVAGVTNSSCGSCSSLNGDYLPEATGLACTNFTVAIAGSPCGYNEAAIVLTDFDGSFSMDFELRKSGDAVIYSASDNIIDLLAGPMTLAFASGPADCNWPDTVTVVAVAPALSDLASSTYIRPPTRPFVPSYRGSLPVPGRFPNRTPPSAISPEK